MSYTQDRAEHLAGLESRNKCRDCKHSIPDHRARPGQEWHEAGCGLFGRKSCLYVRARPDYCGRDGKLFEAAA